MSMECHPEDKRPSPVGAPPSSGREVPVEEKAFPIMLVGRSGLSLEGLSRIFNDSPFRVVISAPSIENLDPKLIQDRDVRLLILDAGDLRVATREIQLFKDTLPAARIAVIVGSNLLSDLASLFRAGANACLVEGIATQAFLKALELVMLGETLIPSALLTTVSDQGSAAPASSVQRSSSSLSPQERRILLSLVDGHPNKFIAGQLGIADATVKVHIKNIFRKIGVDNRTQAAMWAMNNILPPTAPSGGPAGIPPPGQQKPPTNSSD
jgi:two-component system, NarL family, nitrate/nitrite response regulator NarL